MKLIVIVVCCLSVAVPCFAQTFTLNPVTHCPGLGYGVHFGLTGPYTYHIEYVSGAYSPFPDDSYQLGYTWYSRVHYYIYANGSHGTLGSGSLFQTPAAAEAAAQGVYPLYVPSGGTVEFYIEELAPSADVCADNRGSITLRFVWPVATQPTTWGKVKALYR